MCTSNGLSRTWNRNDEINACELVLVDLWTSVCMCSGRVVQWRVTTTAFFGFVAQVNFTCSDGYEGSSPLAGINGTGNCHPRLYKARTLSQPDDEGVFTYRSMRYLHLLQHPMASLLDGIFSIAGFLVQLHPQHIPQSICQVNWVQGSSLSSLIVERNHLRV